MNWFKKISFFLLALVSFSCSDEPLEGYNVTPNPLNIPELFSNTIIPPVIPLNNPQTIQGVALGKKLFFDPILSSDNMVSCATCHAPSLAFTDARINSIGVNGAIGQRNSMPLFNLAWNYDERFAWDGKELSLERQVFEPVRNPEEMNSNWAQLVNELQNHPEYPQLFNEAFGTANIDSVLVAQAIAQFERTLISAGSKFDRYSLGLEELTEQELSGLDVFLSEEKGDCFHCHGNPNNPLWTNNSFHNNALDANFTDLGLGAVTGDPSDNGKFKTPSLRNLSFTAPYMHDGRFQTIDQVIEFYSTGLQNSPTVDPLMKKVDEGGVNLTTQQKEDLKAFLLTLNDESFVNNPDFTN